MGTATIRFELGADGVLHTFDDHDLAVCGADTFPIGQVSELAYGCGECAEEAEATVVH
jgi:hypothetical protein